MLAFAPALHAFAEPVNVPVHHKVWLGEQQSLPIPYRDPPDGCSLTDDTVHEARLAAEQLRKEDTSPRSNETGIIKALVALWVKHSIESIPFAFQCIGFT